jgi:PAS domain S-box-containing protein
MMAFAEHVSEGIAVVDTNGTICFVNTLWAKMHGYAAPSELAEKNICLFHTPRQVKTIVLPLFEEVRQKGAFEVSLDHTRKDSSAFQTRTKIIALNDTAGQHLGFILFAKDLTENKSAEKSHAELRRANEQLQKQVAKMFETKQLLVQQIDKLKNKSDELHNEILDRNPAQEPNEEAIPIREIPPFDPVKLKALADMAKRLATK